MSLLYFISILSLLLPSANAWTSCATNFGMPPILESPTSTSFTKGPSMTALSYTWFQYVTPTIVGTIHVVVNTDNNVTFTFTSTNSEYATNGSMRIITRTDTNVAGTVTSVVKALDGSNITVAYPTEAFAPASVLLWDAALPTTIREMNVTCCNVRQTSSPTPSHAPFPMPTTRLNEADPSGWLYSLHAVGESVTLPSSQVSSMWSDSLIQLPYTGCNFAPCNISTSCVAADAAQAANPASFMYATTTKTIGSQTSSVTISSSADVKTSAVALPLEEHSASSDTESSQTHVEQSTPSVRASTSSLDNTPTSSESKAVSSYVSTASTRLAEPSENIIQSTSASALTITVHSTITIDTTSTSYDDAETATLSSTSVNAQISTKGLDAKSTSTQSPADTSPISTISSNLGGSNSVLSTPVESSTSRVRSTLLNSHTMIYPSTTTASYNLPPSTTLTIKSDVLLGSDLAESLSSQTVTAILASPITSQDHIESSPIVQTRHSDVTDITSNIPSAIIDIDSSTSNARVPSSITAHPATRPGTETTEQSIDTASSYVSSQSAINGYIWSGVAGTAVTTSSSSNSPRNNATSTQNLPSSSIVISNKGTNLRVINTGLASWFGLMVFLSFAFLL